VLVHVEGAGVVAWFQGIGGEGKHGEEQDWLHGVLLDLRLTRGTATGRNP